MRLRWWAALPVMGIAAAACGSGGAGTSADSVTLELSHSLPQEHPQAEAMARFAELVEEKSDGRVIIQIFPAAQLYNEVDLIDALPAGTTDMGLINMAQWSGTVPTSQVWDIPFLFENTEQVHAAADGPFGEELQAQFKERGVHLAAWIDYEFLQLASNAEIRSPEDLEGRNIRTASALVAQAIQAAGGASVTMSGSEAYTALQRGTVDGALSGYTSFADRAYYEVTNHVTGFGIVFNMFSIAISDQTWTGLNDAQREAINEASSELQDWQRDQQAAAVEEARNTIQEKGMMIYTPTPEEMESWRSAVAPVRQEYLDLTGEEGKTLLEKLEDQVG